MECLKFWKKKPVEVKKAEPLLKCTPVGLSVRDVVVLLLDHFDVEIVHKESGVIVEVGGEFTIRRRDDK